MLNGSDFHKKQNETKSHIEELAKISSKGQITIPVEIRSKLGIKEGDQLRFIYKDGEVTVEPVRMLSSDELFGILNQPEDNGHFVLDINTAREERAEEVLRNNWINDLRRE